MAPYAPHLIATRDRSHSILEPLGRLLPQDNLAATVYGTVLVSSVIVGLGGADYAAGWTMAAVGVTTFVFALAHAWSTGLAHSADLGRPMSLETFRHGISHEWPMVEAAAPALVALGLAVAGVYSVQTGLWVAMAANTAFLFVWGAALRQRAGGTPAQITVAGLATSMLGLVVVALKVLVH
jgi:hypothetical protein